MPKRTGPYTAVPSGASAYNEAKAMLGQEMAFNRRSAPILSYLRQVMIRIEDRGYNLTSEDFHQIDNEVDAVLRGHDLLDAARDGDAVTVRRLIGDEETPVNFQDPRTGATALHYAAAYRARPTARALLKSGRCDFLIRDRKGRLAWELASNADDAAMTRLLLIKTASQARERGVPLRRREPLGTLP